MTKPIDTPTDVVRRMSDETLAYAQHVAEQQVDRMRKEVTDWNAWLNRLYMEEARRKGAESAAKEVSSDA